MTNPYEPSVVHYGLDVAVSPGPYRGVMWTRGTRRYEVELIGSARFRIEDALDAYFTRKGFRANRTAGNAMTLVRPVSVFNQLFGFNESMMVQQIELCINYRATSTNIPFLVRMGNLLPSFAIGPDFLYNDLKQLGNFLIEQRAAG